MYLLPYQYSDNSAFHPYPDGAVKKYEQNTSLLNKNWLAFSSPGQEDKPETGSILLLTILVIRRMEFLSELAQLHEKKCGESLEIRNYHLRVREIKIKNDTMKLSGMIVIPMTFLL